ncbi:uncharacterized protein V6R79_002308 [Siganus canaliculatus]
MVHTVAWSLFFLAALIPGAHLQGDDGPTMVPPEAEPPSEAQIYRPVLQPSEAVPQTGTYTLRNQTGKLCIRATIGVEYIVIEKKTWYFNLDPSRVRTSGYCNQQAAVLSLTLPDNAASLQLFFTKDKNRFSVSKLTAHVFPLPVCKGCRNKTYTGLVAHEKLFAAADGRSFTCKSENLLLMSSNLRVKLVPVKIQAFTLPNGQYGKEVECWADYNKRVIPIIIGAVVVGLILIAVLTYLLIRDRRTHDYERL